MTNKCHVLGQEPQDKDKNMCRIFLVLKRTEGDAAFEEEKMSQSLYPNLQKYLPTS